MLYLFLSIVLESESVSPARIYQDNQSRAKYMDNYMGRLEYDL